MSAPREGAILARSPLYPLLPGALVRLMVTKGARAFAEALLADGCVFHYVRVSYVVCDLKMESRHFVPRAKGGPRRYFDAEWDNIGVRLLLYVCGVKFSSSLLCSCIQFVVTSVPR